MSIERALAHIPTLNSDTSTSDVSPVRSRANSAAAIPPAIVMPPMESPYAGAGMWHSPSVPGGVTPTAWPARDQ